MKIEQFGGGVVVKLTEVDIFEVLSDVDAEKACQPRRSECIENDDNDPEDHTQDTFKHNATNDLSLTYSFANQ